MSFIGKFWGLLTDGAEDIGGAIFDVGGALIEGAFDLVGDVIGMFIKIPELPDFDETTGELVNKSSNVAKLPVIYGQKRIGGTRVFMGSTDANNRYLHIVIALCEGEIESIDEVWIDDIKSTDSRFTGLVSIPADAATSRTRYGYVGTTTQVADPQLVTAFSDRASPEVQGIWTSAHQLKGVAYIYVRLDYNSDAFSGIPTILCDVRGKRVTDVRTSPHSTAYSVNPALCIRDYLTDTVYGKGLAATSIDDTAISTAANTCDTRMDPHTNMAANYVINQSDHAATDNTVIVTSTASPIPYDIIKGDTFTNSTDTTQYLVTGVSGTAPDLTLTYTPSARTAFSDTSAIDLQINYFECSGALKTDRKVMDNVKLLMTSCRGMLPYIAGKYTLTIEQEADSPSSTFSFTTDNITGGWSFTKGSKRYRLNNVKAQFANPSKNWRSDIVVQDSTTYRTEDNEILLEKTIPLLFETNPYRALYMANTVLKKSRQDISVSFTATLAALDVKAGGIVDVTHLTPGWTSKLFRVASITLLASGNLSCQLQEHEEAVYDRTAPAGVAFPADTELPNPFETRISGGDVELRAANWTYRSNPSTKTLLDIAVGGGVFAAVGDTTGTDPTIITSSNGIEWSLVTPSVSRSSSLFGVIYDNTQFVAVGTPVVTGSELITNGAFTSDTTGWSVYSDAGTAVISSSSSQLLVDHNSSAQKGRAVQGFTTVVGESYYVSVDVVSYDAPTAFILITTESTGDEGGGTDIVSIESSDLSAMTFTTDFVATATTTYIALYAYSTDNTDTAKFDNVTVKKMDGYGLTSPAAVTWTAITPPVHSYSSVAYDGSIYVIVGGNSRVYDYSTTAEESTIITTTDLSSFTSRTSAASNPINEVIHDGTQFIAVGGDTNVAELQTSTNGTTWSLATTPTPDGELHSIAYDGHGVYVAVGEAVGGASYVIRSTDLVTWTSIASVSTTHLYSVVYGDGLFVVTGGSSGADTIALTSIDGTTWNERVTPNKEFNYGLVYDDTLGVFVSVGFYTGSQAQLITSLYR